MITLFVGEDTVGSRKKFIDLKEQYQKNQYLIIDITPDNLANINKWLYESQSLFEEKKVFFGENIVSKKENRQYLAIFDTPKARADCILWDEKADPRSSKTYFKFVKIVESKLPATIFTFLDSVFPTNKPVVFKQFNQLKETVDGNMILYMLQQRFRDLIIVHGGLLPQKKLADWQVGKLKGQANQWSEAKLVSMYDALYRIEVGAKTGKSVYSINQALDILLALYL